MTRAIFTTRNAIEFTAEHQSGARVHVFQYINRSSVYYVRRLIRRYKRDGYHVHAAINHNGRILCNVFGSDIYTQARKREEA